MRLGKKWKAEQLKTAGDEHTSSCWGRTTWRDVERSLRRRMRIYPSTLLHDRPRAAEGESECDLGQLDIRLPAGGRGAAGWRNPEINREGRKVIVSIYGRDVNDGDLDLDEQEAITR
jgi:hypothetical protein